MFATTLESAIEAQTAGRWDEALERYEAALSVVARGGNAEEIADIYRRIGNVHRERGDLELAIESYDVSLEIARANELRTCEAAALVGLAAVEQMRGRLDVAEELYIEARTIAEEVGDERTAAMADQNLGTLANIRGDIAVALSRYGSALERHVRLGDNRTAAGALINMAMAHIDLEEWRAAESEFDEAHGLATSAGDTVLVGWVELNRAELYLKRQQYEAARESCSQAVDLFGRLRSKPMIGEAYKFYGMLYRETSKLEQAGLHLALSLGLAEACENRLLQAEAQLEWALVHLDEERQAEAIRRMNRAYKIFTDLQARRELLDIDRRLNRLRETYIPTVAAWGAGAVEAADPFKTGRSHRIANYTDKLAEAAGVSGWDRTWLRAGAFVHDVGNSAVPMEVIGKPGSLTRSEREIVQSHTVLGDGMMSEMDFPDEVRPIVRNHHERWDGKGYPDKMGGEDIPLNARILSVVDVFDALTSDRSYRKAYSRHDALQIMEQESSRSLDPELCGMFREIVGAEGSLALV